MVRRFEKAVGPPQHAESGSRCPDATVRRDIYWYAILKSMQNVYQTHSTVKATIFDNFMLCT
jgi:hypothetical protein